MKEVLEIMIKNLVDNADAVSIKELNGEKSVVYEVKVARAVRAIMKSVASKENKKVTIEFIN